MEGVVIKSTGSWYTVKVETGKILNCRIKGKFRIKGIKSTNPIAVGDKVELEVNDEATWNIIKLFPRKNYIIRKSINLSKRTHIIASNIDQALLIVTIEEPVTTNMFIDRFLITAEAYHIPTIIVFNKKDALSEEGKINQDAIISIYRAVGYRCEVVSAIEKTNIDIIKEILKDKTTLLSGHSGVGKSTLINNIEPVLNIKTAELTESHKLGKHTTTFAEMFPLSFGGAIIDTPGIKSFGIVDFKKEELSHRFPEMRKLIQLCFYNNCLHLKEPKCGVKDAVYEGKISESRYNNYVSIYHDDENEKYR